LKTKITAYRGRLIIDTDMEKDCTEFLGLGSGHIGCILSHTKKHLGVSAEAIALMKTVEKGSDSLGDLMWWGGDFMIIGWTGNPCRVMDPAKAETDRDFEIRGGHYIEIPNDVPDQYAALIDSELPPGVAAT
jgi:hypothetical protein